MLPAGLGPRNPIRSRDSIDLPVVLRFSSPLSPGRRPGVRQLDRASSAWPVGTLPMADGLYMVNSSWRALLDAALTAGRDPRTPAPGRQSRTPAGDRRIRVGRSTPTVGRTGGVLCTGSAVDDDGSETSGST